MSQWMARCLAWGGKPTNFATQPVLYQTELSFDGRMDKRMDKSSVCVGVCALQQRLTGGSSGPNNRA